MEQVLSDPDSSEEEAEAASFKGRDGNIFTRFVHVLTPDVNSRWQCPTGQSVNNIL